LVVPTSLQPLLLSKSAERALFLYFPTSILLYLTVSWKLPAPEAELDVDDDGLQGDAGLVWDLA